jgi:hypothetical protein
MIASRRAGTSSVAILAALLALTYGLTIWLAPDWSSSAGLDVWELHTLHKKMEVERDNDLELRAKLDDVQSRIATKGQLIENLLQGQMTLKHVISEFLALNENGPAMISIRAAFVGKTDEEKMARNVIAFADMYAVRSPQLALRVKSLHTELDLMIAGNAPQD